MGGERKSASNGIHRMHGPVVRDATPGDFSDILRLNMQWEHFLSPMDLTRLQTLHRMAATHRVVEDGGAVCAFLLAMREGCAYDSLNYRWFSDRYPRFLYVDRLVIAGTSQARGLGRSLYADLLALARTCDVDTVTCEIDADPPNEPSRRLHAALGFREVGTQRVGVAHKRVSMQALQVAAQ